MEALLGLLAAALAGSVGYLVAWERGRSRTLGWKAAAQRTGLTDVKISSVAGVATKMTARSDRLLVTVESYQSGKAERGARVIVGGLGHEGRLFVQPEGVGSRLAKVFGDSEVELGDAAFDRVAYVQGETSLVRALFSAEARRFLAPLLEGRLPAVASLGDRQPSVRTSITENELRVEIRERAFEDTSSGFADILKVLVDGGRMLLKPDDLAERIAGNNGSEPYAAVRTANLRTLASEYPNHAATRRALEAGLADPSPDVRLQAAVAIGADGEATLVRLAGSDDVPETVAAGAVAALAGHCPDPFVVETLRRARQAGRAAVVRACVDALAYGGAAAAQDDLAELASGENADLAVASARVLGTLTGEASERALIAALRHPSVEVCGAAAVSLGRTGTPLAVAPLHICAAAHRQLRAATRQAIAEIQSRVAGASPGQLSLTVNEVGQVSLAEPDTRGHVSLADEDKGNDQGTGPEDGPASS